MKYILLATILSIIFYNTDVSATTYAHTDTINTIGALTIRDEADFIYLNGFTSAGSCPVNSNGGFVVARFPNSESGKRAYAVALAAKISGKSVRLSVDDADKNPLDGNCYVRSLQLSE